MPTEYITRPAAPRAEFRLNGKHVLAIAVTFFGIVASVNGFMMRQAFQTMPGLDARNGYDPSQRFNKDQEAARERFERGWTSAATLLPAQEGYQLSVQLLDKTQRPLSTLALEVRLAHPADRRRDLTATLTETAPGTYTAHLPAARAGAWDLTIEARRPGDTELLYTSHARTLLKG